MGRIERCGRAWTLISKLDDINIDPCLVKYRTLVLVSKIYTNLLLLLGYMQLDDDPLHLVDDSSILEIANSIKCVRPLAIPDPNGLKHHIFDLDNIQKQEFPGNFD